MRLAKIPFVPLASGERPGDPELGGWRPLSLHYLGPGPVNNSSSVSSATMVMPPFSLKQAVQFVADQLWRFQLRQAIEAVAECLAKRQRL